MQRRLSTFVLLLQTTGHKYNTHIINMTLKNAVKFKCLGMTRKKMQNCPATAMQELREEEQKFLILDVSTRLGERSASRPGRNSPPGKGPRYTLDRRQDGPQIWSGHRG